MDPTEWIVKLRTVFVVVRREPRETGTSRFSQIWYAGVHFGTCEPGAFELAIKVLRVNLFSLCNELRL